jgi:hypothetical protein
MRLWRLLRREKPVDRPLPAPKIDPEIDLSMPVLKAHLFVVTMGTRKYPSVEDQAWGWRN